jgi:ubiquinone/menaquinone biosynthesis C-methylase UbiE
MPFNTSAWNCFRYTLYAPVYDLFAGRVGLLQRARSRAAQLAALRPGERVLILAAGTGLDLPLLPRGVEVVATDINRRLSALVDATELVVTHREAVGLGGNFVVARAEKPVGGGQAPLVP